MPRSSRPVLLTLALCLPAALPAAATAATPSYPSIAKVAPMKLGVGDTLTLTGKGYRTGRNRNTVVFKRDGGRAIFVKAARATRTTIRVTIPAKLLSSLSRKSGKPVATRFRIRVLAGRFGRRFTAASASPVISPVARSAAAAGPAGVPGAAGVPGIGASTAIVADCNGDARGDSETDTRACALDAADPDLDGDPNRSDDDDDNDRLTDGEERGLGLDQYREDTDGDGAGDGLEYYSARDLNGANVPFPGKRPYPNALDREDGGIDHDGDGLTLVNEFRAWKYTGAPLPLSYSDGNQNTRGGDIDAYKDVDGDGASNYAEVAGPLSGNAFWTAWVKDNNIGCPGGDAYVESTYPGPRYTGLDFVDPDSDGDGILDGPDDIDHDGLTNLEESRYVNPDGSATVRRADWCDVYVSVGPGSGNNTPSSATPGQDLPGADRYARTNPFNPCKPVYSEACHKFVPLNYYVKSDTYVEDWAGAAPNR